MSDAKAQQEPSIEEILSSIRQIINEDGDDAGKATPAAAHQPAVDDVLDLADIVEPESPAANEPMKVDDIDAMFDAPAPAAPAPAPAVEPEPAPAPVAAAQAPAPVAEINEDSLMSSGALEAAAASLTKLAQAEVKIDHRHAAGIGSVTLEDVVKEMLRPMMKSWLDENLPPLVERLVQKEIQKISSRL